MTGMEGGHASARTTMTLAEQNRAAKKAAFLLALREDGTLGATCKRTGMSESTIFRWRRDDPEFNEACEAWLKQEMVDILFESLFQIVLKGPEDPKYANAAVRAGEFLLKAMNPEMYGERIRIDKTVTGHQQVAVIHEARDRIRAEQAEKLRYIQTRRTGAESSSQSLGNGEN